LCTIALFSAPLLAVPARAGDAADLSDLPADLAGADFRPYDSGHYRIYDQGPTDWAPAAARLLECVRGHFYEIWSENGFPLEVSEQPLVWLHFADRGSFDHYARTVDRIDLSWAEGYYSARTHRVAVFSREETGPEPIWVDSSPAPTSDVHPHSGTGAESASPADDLRRLTHEAAHQLAFSGGLLKRGVMYPVWVSEGLAMHFEADEAGRIGAGSDDTGRRTSLVRAARAGSLMPLSRFLVLTRIPSDDKRSTERVYDQAWGMFAMLLSERPESLRAYLRTMALAGPGRRSEETLRSEAEAAFGDLDALDAEWQRFLLDFASSGVAPAPPRTCS
jgi:hypothetical protein